ncbi:hypothetical protein LR48_Vigan181s002100 [Vigna angularis]|uniref:Uncharacterized protein n=1 Tax=Phaseolus angularis TaxID=3914 RepID=A0A0L9T584_PHAAN|nr:hypothetical protein LR48_Vigan181s002100 [Vigna angularis]
MPLVTLEVSEVRVEVQVSESETLVRRELEGTKVIFENPSAHLHHSSSSSENKPFIFSDFSLGTFIFSLPLLTSFNSNQLSETVETFTGQ